MQDDPSPASKRSARRARIDAPLAGKPGASAEGALPGLDAPMERTEGLSGRERLAAAVGAVGASSPKGPKSEVEEVLPGPKRRRGPDATPKPVWIERSPQPRRLSALAQAATLALALGLGWAVGSRGPAPAASATPESVQALADEVLRLEGDLRSLKSGVEAVRDGVERERQDNAARLQHVRERLDAAQPDREAGARLASLAQRVERLEGPDRDLSARLAQISERLDRTDKQLASRVMAPIPAPPAPTAPEQTGSVAEARPPTKPTLDRWALRDVHQGVALIEGQTGGLVEVLPGQSIPGVGRVEAIERRGKAWVVVTNRGIITAQNW